MDRNSSKTDIDVRSAICDDIAAYIKRQKELIRHGKEVLSEEDRQEEIEFVEEIIRDAEERIRSAWQLIGEILHEEERFKNVR